MKILNAVLIFSATIIILVIVYLVLYLVIKPLVYTPPVSIDPITLGDGTIFLVNMAQSLIEDNISTNPFATTVSATVTVASSNISNFNLNTSTRSTAFDPPFNNNYPSMYTSLSNIFIEQDDGIGVEVIVNTITGDRTNLPIQITYYYNYVAEVFGERFFYIMPDGIYGDGNIVNNVVVQMDPTGLGVLPDNLSLRLKIGDDDETEICFIDSSISNTVEIINTFMANQTLLLYHNVNLIGIVTVGANSTLVTASTGGLTII